jgi:sporulation protein YlmC with PRC-barrel domain
MGEVDTSSAPSHPLIESDRIEGTAVYDANGKRVGSIKRLVIEKLSGHVAYAVTSFGGFLGVGSELHTIPWEQLHYDTMLGGYKTSISEDQLRKAPEFSRSDESLLSGHERQQLTKYYTEYHIPPLP